MIAILQNSPIAYVYIASAVIGIACMVITGLCMLAVWSAGNEAKRLMKAYRSGKVEEWNYK